MRRGRRKKKAFAEPLKHEVPQSSASRIQPVPKQPLISGAKRVERQVDLSSWQKKFSGFASGFQLTSLQGSSVPKNALSGSVPLGEPPEFPDRESLVSEWRQFLEGVSRSEENSVLSAHLNSCELVSCGKDGVFTVSCCRKFSYEQLLPKLPELQQLVADFYHFPVLLRLVYDAEKDICTKERTVFTLFRDLSEKNAVLQFIIKEFGGELLY